MLIWGGQVPCRYLVISPLKESIINLITGPILCTVYLYLIAGMKVFLNK